MSIFKDQDQGSDVFDFNNNLDISMNQCYTEDHFNPGLTQYINTFNDMTAKHHSDTDIKDIEDDTINTIFMSSDNYHSIEYIEFNNSQQQEEHQQQQQQKRQCDEGESNPIKRQRKDEPEPRLCHLEGDLSLHYNDHDLFGYNDDYSPSLDDLFDELLKRQKLWYTPEFFEASDEQLFLRRNLFNWLMLVSKETNIKISEILIALAYTDFFLNTYNIQNSSEAYLLGCVCLTLAIPVFTDESMVEACQKPLNQFICNSLQLDQLSLNALMTTIQDQINENKLYNLTIPCDFVDFLINRLRVCRKHRRSYRTDDYFILSVEKFITHAAMFPLFNLYPPAVVASACIIAALQLSGYGDCMIDSTISILSNTIKSSEDYIMDCHCILADTFTKAQQLENSDNFSRQPNSPVILVASAAPQPISEFNAIQ